MALAANTCSMRPRRALTGLVLTPVENVVGRPLGPTVRPESVARVQFSTKAYLQHTHTQIRVRDGQARQGKAMQCNPSADHIHDSALAWKDGGDGSWCLLWPAELAGVPGNINLCLGIVRGVELCLRASPSSKHLPAQLTSDTEGCRARCTWAAQAARRSRRRVTVSLSPAPAHASDLRCLGGARW